MKVTLWCSSCDKKFNQIVEYIGDINWVCPKCKSDVFTWTRDIENKNTEPLGTGRGGCGPTGFK